MPSPSRSSASWFSSEPSMPGSIRISPSSPRTAMALVQTHLLCRTQTPSATWFSTGSVSQIFSGARGEPLALAGSRARAGDRPRDRPPAVGSGQPCHCRATLGALMRDLCLLPAAREHAEPRWPRRARSAPRHGRCSRPPFWRARTCGRVTRLVRRCSSTAPRPPHCHATPASACAGASVLRWPSLATTARARCGWSTS